MTQSRPIPDAQRAPWPPQPSRHTEAAMAPRDPVPIAPEATPSGGHGGEAGLAIDDRTMKKLGVGTAIGVGAAIGSAAIAAALLYANYGRRK